MEHYQTKSDMDIKNETLRRMLAGPFGWNVKKQNLLGSNVTEGETQTDGRALAVVDKELSERAAQRLVASEVNKQKNMEDVIQRADEILQKEPSNELTSEESDQGWVEDCLDGAGKAYDDELKDYWAKLLAGEIRNPGKYSKRITNFMKTISQKDAERIKKICPYVMYDMKGDAVILRYNGEKISYEDISFLAELRLLNSSSFVVKQYKFAKGKGQAFFFKKNIGYLLKIDKEEYALPIYAVTQLGKEVLSIVDDAEADIDYLKDFSISITKRKSDLVANCGYFITINDGALLLKEGQKFEIPKPETNEAEINNDIENK